MGAVSVASYVRACALAAYTGAQAARTPQIMLNKQGP